MIISASRRTDIPAFYSEWFMNRLREKKVMIQGPKTKGKYTEISLAPEVVDCIVFWTKNPSPLIPHLKEIDERGYPYYFQFTLNPYPARIEPHLPTKRQLVDVFRNLSIRIGMEKVIWRYDPIILTPDHPISYHVKTFEDMVKVLGKYTSRCVVSFLDIYESNRQALSELDAEFIDSDSRFILAREFSQIAQAYGLELYSCAEAVDWGNLKISHGACIDPQLISKISSPLKVKKDSNQRPACRCAESIDIGAYESCSHGCVYCYANYDLEAVLRHKEAHDPKSPLLIGWPKQQNQVIIKEIESKKDNQISLF